MERPKQKSVFAKTRLQLATWILKFLLPLPVVSHNTYPSLAFSQTPKGVPVFKKTHALFMGSFFCFSQCGFSNNTSNPSRIIGENDLLVVLANGENIPDNFKSVINAIGFLESGCTVTHIGNGIAITAGHCIPLDVERGENAKPWNNMKIRWSLRTGVEKTPESNSIRVFAAESNDNSDFAILIVNTPPDAHANVNMKPEKIAINSPITIFSHPWGRPLEWSQMCTAQAPVKQFANTQRVAYQCDTDPGSSGAAVLDVNSAKVLAVHSGGTVDWNNGTPVNTEPMATLLKKAYKFMETNP